MYSWAISQSLVSLLEDDYIGNVQSEFLNPVKYYTALTKHAHYTYSK